MSLTISEVITTEEACYILYGNVTDGDTRIYAEPEYGYLFQMFCSMDILTTYKLQLTLPSDFIVVDRSSCTFALTDVDETYICNPDADNNVIEISSFLDDTITAEDQFEFYVNSIINPGTYNAYSDITIAVLDADDEELAASSYQFRSGYFTAGNITTFTVSPQSTAVNDYPTNYTFNVIPNGEIERYAYLVIELPDEVEILEDNDLETFCGYNLYAFTNDLISCVVTNNRRTIQVKDGFLYEATANFTDDDGLYFPPDLQFTLQGFRNPRESGYSSPWNVTIYNEFNKVLYYWQSEDSPTIRMSGVNAPAYIEHTVSNGINGAIADIEFLITTTSPITEGDKFIIVLPDGWYFTDLTYVTGSSTNLAANMTSVVIGTLEQIDITAELGPQRFGRRLANEEQFLAVERREL